MSSPIDKQSFGQSGATFESGTDAVSGDFCALQVVGEAVLASLSWPELSGDSLVGVTIPAGVVIYGQISGFTLASGSVLAYKASR